MLMWAFIKVVMTKEFIEIKHLKIEIEIVFDVCTYSFLFGIVFSFDMVISEIKSIFSDSWMQQTSIDLFNIDVRGDTRCVLESQMFHFSCLQAVLLLKNHHPCSFSPSLLSVYGVLTVAITCSGVDHLIRAAL